MSVTNEDVAALLLIDGIPIAFSNDERITAAYVAALGENHTSVHFGLELPRGLNDTLDLVTGLLADSSATFSISDVDGTLAALFASDRGDIDELLFELEPGDTALASEYDRNVGVELIGPAGQRRRCSCIPGWNIGDHHISSAQAFAYGVEPTSVSDSPRVWVGRRMALYRLVRSAAGVWPADISTSLVWWGSMLGRAEPEDRVWPIKAAGRESWAMGTIGIGLPKEPLRARAVVQLDPDLGETMMRANLATVYLYDLNIAAETTFVLQSTDSSSLIGASTYEDIAAIFDAWLASIAAIGGGASFDSQGNSSLGFSTTSGDDGVWIRYDRTQDAGWLGGFWTVARLTVTMHEKVWKALGYEPSVQNAERDPVDNFDQYGKFEQSPEWLPGRWQAQFYSASPIAMKAFEDNTSFYDVISEEFFSYGYARRWPPIYPGGCQVLDMGAALQEVQLVTLDPLFLPSTKAAPLAADPDQPNAVYTIGDGVGAVTHQGVMIFRGPYRRARDEDNAKAPAGYSFGIEREREEGRTVQVARVCWREGADGSLAIDSTNFPRVVIYEWLEPRLYGVGFDRISGQWASWREAPDGAVETMATPLLAIESSRGGDSTPLVIAQLLASTGTAGAWYTDDTLAVEQFGIGGSPDLDVGANDLALDDIGDERLGRWTDVHSARLGRRIPAQLIAGAPDLQGSFALAIAELADLDLARCKATTTEPASMRKLLGELLSPLGWCMSLAGGRFGMFDPWTFRAPISTGTITSEAYAAKPGDPSSARPKQSLRKLSPIDRLEVQATRDPSANTFAKTFTIAATDSAAHVRPQTITRQILGTHLVHEQAKANGSGWKTDFHTRWNRGFTFWASAHYEVTFTVSAARAGEFEVGSIVSITDSWVVSPGGVYGVAQAPGFVTARSLDFAAASAKVTALISADTLLQYAPAVVVTRYDANDDAEGYRLFCEDDAFGSRQGDGYDVDGLVEPDWSTAGGAALLEGFAFDGVSWTRGIFGTVASIDTSTPGSTFVQLSGALTGATFYSDRWHVFVLREAATQSAAWVSAVHAPICDKDGTSNGALGKKFTG